MWNQPDSCRWFVASRSGSRSGSFHLFHAVHPIARLSTPFAHETIAHAVFSGLVPADHTAQDVHSLC